MRRSLLRGGADLGPQVCAYCGKRVVIGVIFSITISKEKFKVCSYVCEKALKAEKEPAHDQGRQIAAR